MHYEHSLVGCAELQRCWVVVAAVRRTDCGKEQFDVILRQFVGQQILKFRIVAGNWILENSPDTPDRADGAQETYLLSSTADEAATDICTAIIQTNCFKD